MSSGPQRELVADTEGDDVCLAEEADLAVVDAFNSFYRQLASVNAVLVELHVASQQDDVTVLLLARTNLAWDLLDVHLEFLASSSRSGTRVHGAPALGVANTRLRRILEQGLSYRRTDGRAGDLLAQARRLAERLQRYEAGALAGTTSRGTVTGVADTLACRRIERGLLRRPRVERRRRDGRTSRSVRRRFE